MIVLSSDQTLRSAAEALIRLSHQELADCPQEGDTSFEFGPTTWVPMGGGPARVFMLRPTRMTEREVCVGRRAGDLKETPEYRAVLDELRNHPVTSPRIGRSVGSAAAGMRPMDTEQLIIGFITAVVSQSEQFDAEVFDHEYEQHFAVLSRETEVITLIAPLVGLDAGSVPLNLEAGVDLIEMTDDEIAHCLSFGALPAPFAQRGSAMVNDVFAVRVTYDVTVSVDEYTDAEIERANESAEAAVQSAEGVLRSLRLFKRGRVRLGGAVSFGQSTGWMRGGEASGGGWLSGDRYELSAEETNEFSAFHRDVVTSASGNRKLAASARRFTYAGDRPRSDDEIVDLVISAESLYLSDIGEEQRGEMRFRVAIRCASFVEVPDASRRQVARFMKRAYDARSGVVHGGDLDQSALKNLDDVAVTVGEFADVLEEIMRLSIQKVVRLVAAGKAFPPDWDGLLFP